MKLFAYIAAGVVTYVFVGLTTEWWFDRSDIVRVGHQVPPFPGNIWLWPMSVVIYSAVALTADKESIFEKFDQTWQSLTSDE